MSTHETDPSNERIRSTQQGSLFESSRNVEMTEAQLNSVRGHQANLTITFNQYAENDCLRGDETRVSPVIDNVRNFTPICNLPPLPVRRSCDIYYRHLAAKGRGSPMWEPEPSSTLPDVYRRRGIAVGDVGIITASGGFDFMFNVCLPSDHPINEQSVPDGFLPILPHLWARDIRKRMVYNANSYLASESVAKSHRESESSEIAFESSASEGAILTMPQGAHAEDLGNVSQFRRYFSSNAESWYRYINNIRGREAKNGDVRLVIGCDKASSWGMATISNSAAQEFRLKFKPKSESGSRRTYEWEYSAMVDARVGPDPEEMEDLRSTDDSENSNVYKNQCLFVRTLNATLRDDVWKGLGLDYEIAMDIQFDSYANPYGPGPSSSINPSAGSPNSAGPSSSNLTTTGGSTCSSGLTSLPWTTLPPVLIENFNTALTTHPSKTMNTFMLTENPRARIAITRDDDWISLIVESDQRLPPPDELINRMLATHDVCEADGKCLGTVFLQLKPKDQSTNVSFKQSDKRVNMPPIPLGCRFVPYDQWFITHIPPTWKIRHLKQHILAKCLNLPWDAQKIVPVRDAVVEKVAGLRGTGGGMGVGDGTGRPPSPITFAPEERGRSISPIEFASLVSPPAVDGVQPESDKMDGEAWEDLAFPSNETGDDDAEVVIPGGTVEVPPLGGGGGRGGFIRKPLSKLASSIPFSPISAGRTRGVKSPLTRISQPYGTHPDEQIRIAGFTLVRFTTGQILEDDCSIAWYQLAPHELVELHASRPQRGFAVAVHLAQLLEVKRGPSGVLALGGEGGVGAEQWWEDLGGEEAKSPGAAAAKDRKGKEHVGQPLSLSLNSFSLSAAKNVTRHMTSTISANNNTNAHENSTSTSTATATTAAAIISPYSIVLTSLARHDANAYIQPYWEGWVRCLRVVRRPNTVSSGMASGMVMRRDNKSPPPSVLPYSDFSVGSTSFSSGIGSGLVPLPHAFEGLGLGGGRGMGPYRVGAEEEKKRGEKERERGKREREMEWKERWVVIRDGWVYLYKKRDDPNPPHRNPLAGLLSLEGVEHLQRYQKDKDKQHQDKSQDKEREERHHRKRRDREWERDDRDGHRDRERRTHRQGTSTLRASASAGGGGGLAFFGAEKDRDTGVGVATMPVYGSSQEKPREREREREREKEKKERETERRDKEKDGDQKDCDREHRLKAHELEEHEMDYLRRSDDIPLSALLRKGKEKEREKEKKRERQREKVKGGPDPKSKSYIPFTREEAELAGMKIICAKFKSAAAWEREQRDQESRRPILRAQMEGRILAGAGGDGREGPMTAFGSTSTSTLAGGSTAFGLGMEGGGEKGRERRYTSTGPSLAAVGVFEMDAFHAHPHAPLPPPPSEHHHPLNITSLRKGSLPSLGGLGKLVSGGGSSSGTNTLVGSPLNTNIPPGSGGSVGGGGKFSVGHFSVGKDKDKEEEDAARETRKRVERERKERKKRQKAIEQELKKERKRREGGDWDEEDEVGSSLSWRLGGAGKGWGRGSIPTARKDNEEWERSRLLEKMDPIISAPMPVKKVVVDDDNDDNAENGQPKDGPKFLKNMVSIPTIADSATLHDRYDMDPVPPRLPSPPVHPTTTTLTKPKLHVSTSGISSDAEIHSDSDSCSVNISLPVFAHSTDLEGDDTGRRAEYRYGCYHAKEKEKEKEQEEVKTKDVVDVDKTEEKPDTPAAQHDRGEWVILDMGNDHAFNSILRLFHRNFPQPMSSTFVSDVVEERPLSPTGTASTENPTQEKPSTKPVEEKKTPPNEDETGDNEDDDGIYHTAVLPHLPVLDSIHPHLPNPLPLANPALPYPEWRTELVHRARRHGMREEGRALDLALHGWGREFEEMERRSGVFKRRRREEEVKKKTRRNFLGLEGAGGQRDDEEVGEEGEDEEGKILDQRRMSEASHASMINASCVDAASATAYSSPNYPFRGDEQDQEQEPRISKMPSSSSSDAYTSFRRISIDTFLTPSESSSDPSSSESETEWVAWHTDLSRQRIALKAAKRAEYEQERERQPQQMRVIEEQERERMQQMFSLKRQPSSRTSPERPLSPLTFSNPFAGNLPLEDELNSPQRVGWGASVSAASLNPSVQPSISSNSSSGHQLPPRTQEEERRWHLETRRALEPSANITITDTRSSSSAAPSLPATSVAFLSSSSSSILNQQHSELRLMGSTPSLGSSGRSASPSSILSSNVHPHELRPSASFHSQSQQWSGYGEHMRSPSGQSGRAQVFGMPSSPSVESFGGNWVGMRSSSTPSASTSASVSVSNSPSLASLGPSWAPRTEFSTAPGAINIAVDVVSSLSVSAMIASPVRYPPHSSAFGEVMEGNSGRLPFTSSSSPEYPRQRLQQQFHQPYEFGTAGPEGSDYNLSSASPPPPLPYQQSPPTTTNQHMRTHSHSLSGTLLPSHVPYHVTVSGVGRLDYSNSDREEEERDSDIDDLIGGAGGGGGSGFAMGMGPRRSSSAGLMSTRASPSTPRLNPGTSTTASLPSLSASASASPSIVGSSTSTLTSTAGSSTSTLTSIVGSSTSTLTSTAGSSTSTLTSTVGSSTPTVWSRLRSLGGKLD